MVRSNLRRPAPREDETQLANSCARRIAANIAKLPELLRSHS
jgi:hypothetical protein